MANPASTGGRHETVGSVLDRRERAEEVEGENQDRQGAEDRTDEYSSYSQQAAKRLLGKSASEIPWTTKIERPGVMDLITPDDVIKKMHSLLLSLARNKK